MVPQGALEVLSWLWPFPGRVIIERENLLNALGPAAAEVVEHLESLPDLGETGILIDACRLAS